MLILQLATCLALLGQSAIPPQRDDGWKVGRPEEAGFSSAGLEELSRELAAGTFTNTHAVLVEHDGRLVFERYFDGPDERWMKPLGTRRMTIDELHDLRSVTKSVTSLVLGIALDRQIDAALEKSVTAFFPAMTVEPGYKRLTLHHVLTMTSGMEWNEMTVPYTDRENDEIRLYRVENPIRAILDKPLHSPPGIDWYYNGGLTQLLAGIVAEVTTKPLDAYAREALFAPLGISQYEWLGEPSWKPAMPSAASGLRLRARDLAKIGSLVLHEGRWGGKQIVPAAWVRLSTKRHVAQIAQSWSGGGIYGYGYQWWHARFPQGYTAIAAVGNGNQRIFVLPEERLVVTIFAGEYNKFGGHSERLLHAIMAARRQ